MSADPTGLSAPLPPGQEKPPVSRGERTFNMMTYGGVAGIATFLLSLPIGYWVRYSKGGQEAIKWTAGHVKKVGISEAAAADAVMSTALMQGGNLMLWPIKKLEDKKPELVAKFNAGAKHPDTQAEDTAAEAELKQTWGSLLKSRFLLAWTPVFLSLRAATTLGGTKGFSMFEEGFAKHVVCDPVGHPTHVNGQETLLYKYGRIGAIDVFATIACASLLYAGTRIFGTQAPPAQESAGLGQAPPPPQEPPAETPTARFTSAHPPAGSYREHARETVGTGRQLTQQT